MTLLTIPIGVILSDIYCITILIIFKHHASFEMQYESVALYHALAATHVDVILAGRDGIREEREDVVELGHVGDG